jgi:hypothetical protein
MDVRQPGRACAFECASPQSKQAHHAKHGMRAEGRVGLAIYYFI